ncbi:hypothetical protein [Paenibacillus sp. LjRoot56]|uniref:hypothetical protein n=1 Tax=Paenibacillus sp. LjRoot56 TaxID=3342333 RepID=UPI003ECF7D44
MRQTNADAVILLYRIGELPSAESSEHEGLVETLQGFQQLEDGLFNADSHHPVLIGYASLN